MTPSLRRALGALVVLALAGTAALVLLALAVVPWSPPGRRDPHAGEHPDRRATRVPGPGPGRPTAREAMDALEEMRAAGPPDPDPENSDENGSGCGGDRSPGAPSPIGTDDDYEYAFPPDAVREAMGHCPECGALLALDVPHASAVCPECEEHRESGIPIEASPSAFVGGALGRSSARPEPDPTECPGCGGLVLEHPLGGGPRVCLVCGRRDRGDPA